MNIYICIPAKNPVVCTDIMSNSIPLDCLFTLLTDNIPEDIFLYIPIPITLILYSMLIIMFCDL